LLDHCGVLFPAQAVKAFGGSRRQQTGSFKVIPSFERREGKYPERAMQNLKTQLAVLLLSTLCLLTGAYGQFTPSADSYTNTAAPTTNYGAKTLLDVDGATQATYIQFNLSSIPTGAAVSQATLKLYVNAVTTAGSFEVYSVNGTWAESTLTYDLAPALGSVIDSNVPLTTAAKNQYILINVTSTVQGWVNTPSSNNGLALVAIGTFNAAFDSKENTTTSHPPELDIVFAGDGTITGVTTAGGSGLTGGGTSGTLNLSLTNACAANEVLQWNGSAWICAAVGTGTITSVTAGTDLTGGGTSGNVTLNLNTANVPQLATANTFTGNQTVNGNLTATGVVTGSSYQIGSNLFAFGSYANQNAFLGFSGNSTMSGGFNTATGYAALFQNTTGSSDTAAGYNTLRNNTTGASNTALGAGALYSNTTGSSNSASGADALSSNTTGSFNTGGGAQALQNNTTGGSNTAFGATALYGNLTGCCNTAIGYDALLSNLTGGGNTAIGYETLFTLQSGSENIAVGNGAGTTVDGSNVTGSNNIAVGYLASFSTGSLTNAAAIGSNAEVTESNALVLGSISGVNKATASTSVGIGTTAPAYTLDVHGTGNFTGAVAFGTPVTFAAGQTFPGAGTITGVTPGIDLTGGGTSGNVTLNLNTSATDARYAQLAGANTFTGNQTVTGSFTSTASINVVGDTRVDFNGLNKGSNTPALRFGTGNTGEAIASDRAGTVNVNGIDLYTSFTPRLSVTNAGSVGIGTTAPGYTLDVRGTGSFSSGVIGASSAVGGTGVYGTGAGTGVTGSSSGSGTGVYGTGGSIGVTGSSLSTGVFGLATATGGTASGVLGQSNSPTGAGVTGLNSTSGGYGISGQGYTGVNGMGAGSGVTGTSTSSTGSGVVGIMNSGGGYAGFFQGNVAVTGNATVTGNLAVGGDVPMSSSPRMVFSGFMIGDLGSSPSPFGGFFIPDRNIIVTSVTASMTNGGYACTNGNSQAQLVNTADSSIIYSLDLGTSGNGQSYALSGSLAVKIPAGTNILIVGTAATGCAIGGHSPSNVFINVQYVMQ
jgi:hypothetical protein